MTATPNLQTPLQSVRSSRAKFNWKALQPYLLVSPQTIVLLLFLVLPIAAIIIVSFWNFNGYSMIPGFTLANYITVFTSKVTVATYLNTFKFTIVVLAHLFAHWLSDRLFSIVSCQDY